MILDTLLVAIDNSEFAAQVLQAVGQFKLEPTAKVILVHVVSSDTLDFDAVVDRPHAQGNEIA
ncbi:MAG: universal stress protein, partial [Microcoleus sp. PH2017_06_SFM_O_A]|nr:universal stress protein [Microcoleus sp. PH2017_06_SFM_O_A]